MLIRNPIQQKPTKAKKEESKSSGGLFSVKSDLKPTQRATTSTTPSKPRTKKVVDDSVAVAGFMEKYFSKYKDRYKLVTTEEELIEYMSTRPELGFDTETNGKDDVFRQNLVGFSIGNDNDCIYVPLFHEKGQNYTGSFERLKEILTGGGREYWGMNTKFDRKMMKVWAGDKYTFLRDPDSQEYQDLKWATSEEGFDIPMCWDAEIAARLLDNRELAALKPQYIKYIDPDEEFYDYGTLFQQKFSKYDPAVVGVYGGVDAMKHYVLGKYQYARMKKEFPKIFRLMTKVEMPLISVVMDMELRGIRIDKEYYAQFTAELQGQMQEILDKMQRDFPGFNPNSFKQVGEVLFDKLRLPDPSKSRKTGEEFLLQIHHPMPKMILEYRGLLKAISTYTKAIPELAVQDDKGDWIVHTTYHTIGADTGRFSSSNPNLQNQPKDNRFRRGFIARDGCMLVSTDFSQQEQAVLAGGSQDPEMLRGADNHKDYYALMASIVWSKPYEECTKKGKYKKLRDMCKSLVLGVTYGMSSKSLAEKLNADDPNHFYTEEECDEMLKKFYSGFPKVKEFQKDCMEFGREKGYMVTVLGRRRYFKYLGRPAFECPSDQAVADTLNSLKHYNQIRACLDECKKEKIEVIDNRWRQQDEERQTTNHYCQGSAADQTKVCMVAIANDDDFKNKYHGRILLQVHDEIITEFPEELAEEGGKYVAKMMEEIGSEVINARIWCEPDVMKIWQKS